MTTLKKRRLCPKLTLPNNEISILIKNGRCIGLKLTIVYFSTAFNANTSRGKLYHGSIYA